MTATFQQDEHRQGERPLFPLGYMTATAYLMSLLVYQIGRAMGY